MLWQMWERATSGSPTGRPSTISLNRSRFSPRWIASTFAPMSSTPYRSRAPDSYSEMAVLRAVCPPRVASRASGRSAAMTFSTNPGVIGSM